MYAIAFDLDQDMLEQTYHVPSYQKASQDSKEVYILGMYLKSMLFLVFWL